MNSKKGETQQNPQYSSEELSKNFTLRPFYGPNDLRHVQYMFYSTYLALTPRGIRLRLQSPLVFGPMLAIYAIIMSIVPSYLHQLNWSLSLINLIRIIITGGSVGLVALLLLWYVDKYDVSERVMEALENDLRDLEAYYRGDTNGNFWLLTVSNRPIGCIGIDFHTEPVEDKRHKTNPPKILFEKRGPKEATIRRLAVKTDLQGNGLSTPLVKRVIFWAHSHQIEYLYAETDELQVRAADILSKKFGFVLVSKSKISRFRTKSTWKLDVKLWMSKEVEEKEKRDAAAAEEAEQKELAEYM